MKKYKFHYAWIILIASSVILFSTQGILTSSIGVFLKPVSNTLGVGLGNFTLYAAIGGIVLLVMLPIASILFYKINLRVLLSIAIILMGGSFALMSLQTSLIGFYILGCIGPIGSSFIAYLAAPILINNWFIEKKGLAMGIAISCISLGGIFGNILANFIIYNYNWRLAYAFLGILSIILVLPFTIFLIELNPQNNNMKAYGYVEKNNNNLQNEIKKNKNIKSNFIHILKLPSIYLLIFVVLFIVCCACLRIHLPMLSSTLGYSTVFISLTMSILMIGSLLGSFFIGFLNDKIGIASTTILTLCLGILSIFLMIFFSNYKTFFIISAFLFGLMTPIISVQPPLIINKLFSHYNYSKIYSIIQMTLSLGGIIAIPLLGYMYDFTKSFLIILIFILILLILSLFISILLFYNNKSSKQP
ncbi:MFS transporter [Clostridium tarantellae]|uniref:MFS transporter n=1 Tax=Clostridium tarantellae TaxID=39493 RepID=A0A6I1MNK4_9CLOT|nr:MFS transporter [Clostridium tarantellae]MPQ44058.1 MFS transporter [Clostridium tarantellae]